MITTVFVCVTNSGDGSVYVQFYDNENVASFLENRESEGFAESSISALKIESDSPVKIPKVQTASQVYLSLIDHDREQDADEFKKEFGQSFPACSLRTRKEGNQYHHIDVFVDNEVVFSFFREIQFTPDHMQKLIDGEVPPTL